MGNVLQAYALFTKNTKGDGSFIGSYIAYVTLETRLVDVETGDLLLACTARRNSLNYLERQIEVTNHALIADVHLLQKPLHGATPQERIRYVLEQAVRESLSGIIQQSTAGLSSNT
jgi:hypothetical protein